MLQLLRSVLPLLRPGGFLIYTLKFAGVGRDRSGSLDKLLEQLEGWVEASSCHLVWLMANTVNERCFIAQRLRQGGETD